MTTNISENEDVVTRSKPNTNRSTCGGKGHGGRQLSQIQGEMSKNKQEFLGLFEYFKLKEFN